MLSWIRKQSGSRWVKALMVGVALTFFGGFGILSNSKVQSCMGIDEQITYLAIIDKDPEAIVTEQEFQQNLSRNRNRIINNYRRQTQSTSIPDDLINEDELRKDTMENLVRRKLLLKESEILGLIVGKNELQKKISDYIYQGRPANFKQNDYNQFLQSIGMREQQFESEISKEILLEKVYGIISQGVNVSDEEVKERYAFDKQVLTIEYLVFDPEIISAEIAPKDEVIADFYEDHLVEYYLGDTRKVEYVSWPIKEVTGSINVSSEEKKEYYQNALERYKSEPEQVEARHILIRVDRDAPQADADKAKEKIDEIYTSATEPGADFAQLATELSEGPTGPQGGHLGWFVRGVDASEFQLPSMVDEFETAAFTTEVDKTSDPFRTDFGYHILKVTGKKDAVYKEMKEVDEEITTDIKRGKGIDKIKEEAKNFAKAIKEDGKSFAEAADLSKKTVESSTWFQEYDQSIFDMEDSEKIIDAVFDRKTDKDKKPLDMREVSEPVIAVDHVYIVSVVEKTAERQGTLDEVKDRIALRLKPKAQLDDTYSAAKEYLEKIRADESDFEKTAETEGISMETAEELERSAVFFTGLGYSDSVQTEVSSISIDEPLSKSPYIISDKVLIFKVSSISEANMEKFPEDKDYYKNFVISKKQNEIIEQWLTKIEKGRVSYSERWNEISSN
jgi:peptidyl-prolyl cis-trans isomerase D